MDTLSLRLLVALLALVVAAALRLISAAIRGLDPETLAWSRDWERDGEAESGEAPDEAPILEVLARFVRAARDLEAGAVVALAAAAVAAAPLLADPLASALTIVAGAGIAALLGGVLPEQAVAGREAAFLGRATPVVLALAAVLHPLARAADLVAWPLVRMAGAGPDAAPAPPAGATPPAAAASGSGAEGGVPSASGLREVIAFVHAAVDEVMTPRTEIVAVESGATVADLLRIVRTTRRSAYPIYRESLDDVVGVVTLADLEGASPEAVVDDYAREAVVVPESKRVVDLIDEMRVTRPPLVLVVDEFGATSGLATVHDLIGKLVGEVVADEEQAGFESRRIAADTWVLNPLLRLERFSELTGIVLPGGEYQTLSGYILWRLGRVPGAHERLPVPGGELEILSADERRILSVRVRRPAPARRAFAAEHRP